MIELALSDAGIPYKITSNGEIAINCPFCGDTKFHGRINEKKNAFYCYRRGCSGTLNYVLKALNVKTTFKAQNYNADLNEMLKRLTTEESPKKQQNLDMSKYKPANENKAVKHYLNNRNITDEKIALYDLRYSTDNRVIVPFYENKQCVYYQARAITKNTSLKVINPSRDVTPLGKSNWLFGFDLAINYTQVVITEGWADAISAGINAVSIQGNKLSNAQAKKIAYNWQSVVILLDSDQPTQPFANAKMLKSLNSKLYISIATLPYGDPNSVTQEELQKTLKEAKEYNELEVLSWLLT